MNSELLAHLAGENINVVPLVKLGLHGDPVTVWGGTINLNWNGDIYEGVGNLGEISGISNANDGRISTLQMTLGSLKTDAYDVSQAMIEAFSVDYVNSVGSVWLAAIHEDQSLIGEPELLFAGPVRNVKASDGVNPSITVEVESRESSLRRTRTKFRADQSHQETQDAISGHSNDGFFSFVTEVANKTIYWGMSVSQSGTAGSGGGGSGGRDRLNMNLV